MKAHTRAWPAWQIVACFVAILSICIAPARSADERPWQDIGMGSGGLSPTSWQGIFDGRMMYPLADRVGDGGHERMGLAKNAVYSLAAPYGKRERGWALTPDGLYRTDDHGQTWSYIKDSARTRLNMCTSSLEAVRPVAIDPRDSDIAFVGTDSGRLYRTADAGATWAECVYVSVAPERATWRQGTVSSVTVAMDDPSLIVVTNTVEGAFRSDDRGQTWRKLGALPHPLHIAITPGMHDVLWASCAEDGLWRSDDGGVEFRKLRLEEAGASVREVAIAHRRPGTIYAIGAIGHSGVLYRSSDGGSTWTSNRRMGTDDDLPSLTGISICPDDPDSMVLTSSWKVHFGSQGGASISLPCINGDSLPYVTDMLLHRGRLYAVTASSGLFQSAVGMAHWRQLVNPGVDQPLHLFMCRIGVVQYRGETCILATAVAKAGDGGPFVMILGEDGRIIEKSSHGLPGSPRAEGTLRGGSYPQGLAVFAGDPRIVYLGMNGVDGGLFRSDDGGRTWRRTAGNPGSMRLHEALAVDPRDASRVYWGAREPGEGGVYLSTDAGGTWRHVLADDVLTMHTSASGAVYAGGLNLRRSLDGGLTWTTLTDLSPKSHVISIATDPKDDKRIWFTQSDELDKRQWTHVWQSADGGGTWMEITRNFKGSNGLELCYDPREDALFGGLFSVYKLPLGQPSAEIPAPVSDF